MQEIIFCEDFPRNYKHFGKTLTDEGQNHEGPCESHIGV